MGRVIRRPERRGLEHPATEEYSPQMKVPQAILLLLPACGRCQPTDADLRKQWARDHVLLETMCAEFPSLGVNTISTTTQNLMLAWGRLPNVQIRNGVPTDEDLAAAHLTRAIFDLWIARLHAVDFLSIGTAGDGSGRVGFEVARTGLSVNDFETDLACGPSAPDPDALVPDCYATVTAEGGYCDSMLVAPGADRPGWWIVRER